MTLYSELLAAEIPLDNHEGDLYFKRTEESLEILARHPMLCTMFVHVETGEIWIEAPFQFIPFWEGVANMQHNRTLPIEPNLVAIGLTQTETKED
jgi:hypothetical protein